MKYLDDNGLLYFWSKIKAWVNGRGFLTSSDIENKVDKETGKGLSTEDYTTAEKTKLAGIAEGATANVGTITGITMNGTSKGTSGVVNLGTVLTEHQDISGKADKTETVTNVAYNSSGKKITKTINGTTSDVVTLATLKSGMALDKVDNTSDSEKPVSTAVQNALDDKQDAISDLATIRSGAAAGATAYQKPSTGIPKTDLATAVQTSLGKADTALQSSDISGLAPKASPTFTGTPKAPTAAAGTNTQQIATTEFVKTAIDNSIGAITGVTFEKATSFSNLPATGSAGTIYLVPNSGTNPNVYDEYVWVVADNKYEKIGTTDIDLSGYVETSDLQAITNAEIDTVVTQ